MLGHSPYQLVAMPVAHALGLAIWSLLATSPSYLPGIWWFIWIPVVWAMFNLRAVLISVVGSLPFLGMYVYHLQS